jgi:hypothetical protein
LYRHTQIGWGIIIFFSLFLIPGFWGLYCPVKSFLPISVFFIFILVLFSSLTIVVDDKFVRLKFGPAGFPNRKFELTEIDSCKTAKKLWYSITPGIHFSSGRVLYNVSGTNVVALTMKNGKTRLIGTDEPEKLCEYIQNKIRGRKN